MLYFRPKEVVPAGDEHETRVAASSVTTIQLTTENPFSSITISHEMRPIVCWVGCLLLRYHGLLRNFGTRKRRSDENTDDEQPDSQYI